MILSSVSLLDCIVFLIFLTPQLIFHVGFFTTIIWVLLNSPYLAVVIPWQFLRERLFLPIDKRPPFTQIATIFQDVVIKYVKYGFANLPPKIGRIFFSRAVSLPFMRFRMLRHGYLSSPIPWTEIKRPDFSGLWVIKNPDQDPDMIILYCHGGGFSMGSSYFYLEFLLAWITLLRQSGFRNPAILSLDYSLVPDAVFPTQLNQAIAAYKYALSIKHGNSSHLCIAGDSAGGSLCLSLLLHLRSHPKLHKPALTVLMSPWVTIVSHSHVNTKSDYLNAETLHKYGIQYLGPAFRSSDLLEVASPGKERDSHVWAEAASTHGFIVTWGSEEILASDISAWVGRMRKETTAKMTSLEMVKGIHAWPVAALYLGENLETRLTGLREITAELTKALNGK